MTIEGFFCDPVYGGNRDMAGWRYVGFPGARYDYRTISTTMGRPSSIPPGGADRAALLDALTITGGDRRMAERRSPVDVVLVGFGWTAAIMAQELTEEGLEVLALERGGWRDTATDFPTTHAPDELRYYWRHEMFLETARETQTFRNNRNQIALPIRRWGSYLPGVGVGGAGVHWNGQTFRFLPSDFVQNPQRGALRPPARGNDGPGLRRHL
jgi:hypothetical protein